MREEPQGEMQGISELRNVPKGVIEEKTGKEKGDQREQGEAGMVNLKRNYCGEKAGMEGKRLVEGDREGDTAIEML